METNIKNELKVLMKLRGFKIAKVADKLGIKRRTFYSTLYKGTLRYKDVEQILDVLGKEIVWQDKEQIIE